MPGLDIQSFINSVMTGNSSVADTHQANADSAAQQTMDSNLDTMTGRLGQQAQNAKTEFKIDQANWAKQEAGKVQM